MSTNRTYLNQTVGILPPEARGCGDIETVHQMVQKGNSPDYDPALNKSACYSPDQIKYVDAEGKEVRTAPSVAARKEIEERCPAEPRITLPASYDGWKRFLQAKREERPFLFALLTILSIFIIVKIIK